MKAGGRAGHGVVTVYGFSEIAVSQFRKIGIGHLSGTGKGEENPDGKTPHSHDFSLARNIFLGRNQ
jgi:hypothetical protein